MASETILISFSSQYTAHKSTLPWRSLRLPIVASHFVERMQVTRRELPRASPSSSTHLLALRPIYSVSPFTLEECLLPKSNSSLSLAPYCLSISSIFLSLLNHSHQYTNICFLKNKNRLIFPVCNVSSLEVVTPSDK